MLRITDVVKHLLIINVVVFLIGEFHLVNTDMLALRFPASSEFRPYQIVSHFFMHGGFMHLFFNMFALVMFGSALETLWGPKKFLYFYFVCAFGAALLHMGYSWWDISHSQALIDQFRANPNIDTFWGFFNQFPMSGFTEEGKGIINQMAGAMRNPADDTVRGVLEQMNALLQNKMDVPIVGASGAIYGLLLAFGMYFPNAELMLIFLPIPIKAKYFIPVLMIIELYLGVNQFSWDNIAHFAHLGGALTGFLLILYWRKFGSRFDNLG
ncbi:MAG: rhomboid family intramembrane serine protease [Sinomicrobium sp.]|nr:rhomboid family intramembrane serine protease [Sinomicrobium sp.]